MESGIYKEKSVPISKFSKKAIYSVPISTLKFVEFFGWYRVYGVKENLRGQALLS